MYTRQYNPESSKMAVPENYSGNAILEKDFENNIPTLNNTGEDPPLTDSHNENEVESEPVMARPSDAGFFSGIFKNLPLSNLFSGFDLFKGGFNFGSEEIIIIAISLFLIFTKGADTELGLMLLLLLFIK